MIFTNKPPCDWPECHELAMTLINGKWLCGEHTVKAVKNIREKETEIMFKE